MFVVVVAVVVAVAVVVSNQKKGSRLLLVRFNIIETIQVVKNQVAVSGCSFSKKKSAFFYIFFKNSIAIIFPWMASLVFPRKRLNFGTWYLTCRRGEIAVAIRKVGLDFYSRT